MPRLLKKDSIRLIEASIECLALAQLGISTFHRLDHKQSIVRYAPETGLIGAAIEMIMSAILIQAYNRKVILRLNERYKTGVEILSDFRRLLKQRSANISFLTSGLTNGDEHLNHILNLTNRFNIIFIARANGLHNGIGLNFDVLSSVFQEVSSFIKFIGKSNNLKPYIARVPEMIVLSKDKTILIDELFNSIESESDIEKQKSNIASLFLLLPEVPTNLPQWIEEFNFFNITPKENDIVNLINALEQANPVQLRRVRGGPDSVPVRIENNNPNAIPIQPQYLRASFNQFKDQFFADVSTANGRLENGQLDLPPAISIVQCFCEGLGGLKVLDENKQNLTAHEAWPSISAALNVPSTSVTFPFWNIIRKVNDLGQLRSILEDTKRYGNRQYNNNIDACIYGIDCLIEDKTLDLEKVFYADPLREAEKIKTRFESFTLHSAKKEYDLSERYKHIGTQLENSEITLTEFGQIIKNNPEISILSRKYWMRKIAEASYELESLPFLFEVYNDEDYKVCQTQIKKTMRALDLITFGPRVEIVD